MVCDAVDDGTRHGYLAMSSDVIARGRVRLTTHVMWRDVMLRWFCLGEVWDQACTRYFFFSVPTSCATSTYVAFLGSRNAHF